MVQEGKEPLPCCDLCGMHMPEERIIKHRRMARCDNNTQMRWQRRYVAMANKYVEATFRLMGEDGEEFFDGVGVFKYLRRPLDRWYNNWLEVLKNISKA